MSDDAAHRFRVGQTFTTPGRTITEGLVDQFAGVTGDFNPVHTDHEAARAGLFGKPVAHGMLVLSATIGLWMRDPTFHGVGFAGIEGLRWTKPVGFGDTIHADIEVTLVEGRDKYTLVVAHNDVKDQHGDTVLVFDARLAVT